MTDLTYRKPPSECAVANLYMLLEYMRMNLGLSEIQVRHRVDLILEVLRPTCDFTPEAPKGA